MKIERQSGDYEYTTLTFTDKRRGVAHGESIEANEAKISRRKKYPVIPGLIGRAAINTTCTYQLQSLEPYRG